jgi:hypothetical protein
LSQVQAEDKEGKDKARTDGQIQENTEKAVLEAMDRTEGSKYALKFQGQGSKIYKAASAVSGRAGGRAVFKQAAGWISAKDPGQPHCSVRKALA